MKCLTVYLKGVNFDIQYQISMIDRLLSFVVNIYDDLKIDSIWLFFEFPNYFFSNP
jgi:hypothetical protein